MNGSPTDQRRTALALLAFVAGGAVPIQLVTLSFGYAQYVKDVGMGPRVFAVAHEFAALYIPLVLIPALVVLTAIVLYCKRQPSMNDSCLPHGVQSDGCQSAHRESDNYATIQIRIAPLAVQRDCREDD